MRTYAEERQHWTDLVSRNVPGVTPSEIPRIVWELLEQYDLGAVPDFWHAVGLTRRDRPCSCTDCVRDRWDSHPRNPFAKTD